MASKKTVSSISFNTAAFLKMELEKMLSENLIYFYAFIAHAPEEDTKKDHFHLYFAPNKPLDFLQVRKRFIEPVANEKPLGCLPFQPSKFFDWILYSLHDIDYLNKKGLFRINHYGIDSVVSSDNDFLLQSYYDAKETFQDNRMKLFLQKMEQGFSFGDILRSGIVPPNQIVYWEKVYSSSVKSHLAKSKDSNNNLMFQPSF